MRHRTSRGRRGDGGSAVVEFVALGLVVLLPLVHVVVVVSRVQAGAFAVEAGARAAARVAAAAPDPASGAAQARASVALALRDQGFDVGAGEAAAALRIDCASSPCGRPGSLVAVTVTHAVPLPGAPAVLDAVLPLSVPVTGTSAAVVGDFVVRTPPARAP
jgi:Flp pilus assembly protein TadG